ncbi:hypothetical protein [Pseudomonas phage vB_PaeM_RP7]|uniref:Uncharacterized protein n=2 Tax=Nankokuvirus TaxID=1925779 RepID=V5JWT2_9CAUD|nr:hypothetical protein X837_gp078 [Pseudomonas phage CHA_P1]QEM41003.1 hypothetical protein PAPJP_077 [Pseudomonas phage PAP-JP]UKH48068.1 MAG: hypothetical protein [Pseudomonas phage RP4]WAB56829.1 hypothetical protein [Pseudomonas phage vB_PaeM_RP15]WAB56943.1 hypothetical protein [Pseudomonas phage vB_PaeM_RP6]WAB57148.1 hypothetical protein [Pseudomonas phage vB_PaeM_RP7]WAB57285.1 hypothetical protein [Pseudomonas phage vB_PaeM_RP8]WAB57455.1 hypothetical protein [Pseudomonas phage vB_
MYEIQLINDLNGCTATLQVADEEAALDLMEEMEYAWTRYGSDWMPSWLGFNPKLS